MQKKSNIMERLDNLRALIQEPDFQEGKGLSNEVNIRIFCYDPKDEMAIRHFTEKLTCDQSLNCHLIEYNLYKVFLSILDDKRITDRVAQQEEKKGKQFVLDQMKRLAFSFHPGPRIAGRYAAVFLGCTGISYVSGNF